MDCRISVGSCSNFDSRAILRPFARLIEAEAVLVERRRRFLVPSEIESPENDPGVADRREEASLDLAKGDVGLEWVDLFPRLPRTLIGVTSISCDPFDLVRKKVPAGESQWYPPEGNFFADEVYEGRNRRDCDKSIQSRKPNPVWLGDIVLRVFDRDLQFRIEHFKLLCWPFNVSFVI